MARCCGSHGTCACKVTGGRNVGVSGSGTAQDPFVIESVTALATENTATFNLVLAGGGTLDNPWVLRVEYADSSRLDHLPDVDTPAPVEGQVLTWSDVAQSWVAGPATQAAAGGVLTGNGLEGDGSSGAPLEVTADSPYYLTVRTSGVGLTDEAINRMFRVFADETARDQDPILPDVGTISMLNTTPGRLEWYDGADWQPIDNGLGFDVQPGQLLTLSGNYEGGRIIQWVEQLSATTDDLGDFEVLGVDDLLNYAGVLSVSLSPVGEVGWAWTVRADTINGRILGRAYRVDTGEAYAGYTLDAVVTALLY